MQGIEKLISMKKWIFCCLSFTTLSLWATPYETDLKKFCYQAKTLLELQGHESLLDLSYGAFDRIEDTGIEDTGIGDTSIEDAGIAFFPSDPIQALKAFATSLKPRAKALLIFYPSDEGFHQLAGEESGVSMESFRQEIKKFEFTILHSELKHHLAEFDHLDQVSAFASQYLHLQIQELPMEVLPMVALSDETIQIPTKLVIILLQKK